jgi:hypothetical protein
MQITLKIALAAAGFALANIAAFAVEMPTDGSKNFSAPNDAPSYFTNEAVPESDRVANPATFTSEDVAAAPDVEPTSSSGTETGWHGNHSRGFTRHALGGAKGHGASTHHREATSSNTTRTAAHTGGKSGAPIGGSKSSTTRHAKTGSRVHAAAMPSGASALAREA